VHVTPNMVEGEGKILRVMREKKKKEISLEREMGERRKIYRTADLAAY